MKLKWLVVILMMGFMASYASAGTSVFWEVNVPGDWDDAKDGVSNWRDTDPGTGNTVKEPAGDKEVKIKGDTSVVTVNTFEGWNNLVARDKSAGRMRVYAGATMNIVTDGNLCGYAWIRVGETSETMGGGIGTVNQSGGILTLRRFETNTNNTDKGRLDIGDGIQDSSGTKKLQAGSKYSMSGGTLTYCLSEPNGPAGDGALYVGARGGEGTFEIIGTAPVVQLKNLYVCADKWSPAGAVPSAWAGGTLKYVFGSGVSPIQLSSTAYIDLPAADGNAVLVTAKLVFGNVTHRPLADILLIDATTTIQGTFDYVQGDLNGGRGEEGDTIKLGMYLYRLTYAGGTDDKDLVLEYIPEPATIALLSLGLFAIRRKK